MRAWVVACVLAFSAGVAAADAPAPSPAPHKLIVATHEAPPFIIKNADGSFSGISIDLWRHVADTLRLDYEIRDMAVPDMLAGAKSGAVDVVVSLNISAQREKEMDLTHAFFSTGLGIAVKPGDDGGWTTTAKQFFTLKFAKVMLALIVLLAIVGVIVWLAERKRNEQFGGSAAHGIGAGVWWSAVTMTTVGYGDKSPVTVIGRVLGLIWMFAAIIIISTFTASIASALTVTQLESSINGPDDLPKVKVGAIEPSLGATYLTRRGVRYRAFTKTEDEIAAVDRGEIDAAVGEAPILQYIARTTTDGRVTVLPGTFENHGYGLGLVQGSPLRESIDVALLEYTASDDWRLLLAKYLGPQ
jgi:ABC-type amino acid transport substrate-binding protein